jgi:hypothetical protein
MSLSYRLFLPFLAILLVIGCDQEDQEPKTVSVVQQYSEFQSEWQDMALVYGFAFDNVELADISRNAFAAAFPKMQYRVVTRTMHRWKYERLKKQIEAP